MRRITTAREQVEMLSPWRTAGDVEGYPRHHDKTVWTPEKEEMTAELGQRLQQKGVSGLSAESMTKALQELILMQKEKESSDPSASEDYDKSYNNWEAGYENGDYDEKTARKIIARAFEKMSAPPGFDKVYGPDDEFLRSERPESYPRLKERVVEEPAPPVKRTKPALPTNYFTDEPDPVMAPGKQQMIPEMKDIKRERPVLAPKDEVPMAATVESPEAVKGEKAEKPKQMNLPSLSQNLARFLSPSRMEKSIIDKYNAASEGTKAAGSQWYDTANEYINNLAEKTGRDPRQVGAIMSAFSPQTAWDANMSAATNFIMNYDPQNPNALDDKMGGLSENLERAKRIHAAGDEEGWLAGLQNGNDAHKITNFYHNLMGDKGKVTIDSWMARALLGEGSDGLADKTVQKVLGWKDGYDSMAGAVQSAAKKLGITPRELQATVWSHVVPTAGDYSELSPAENQKKRRQRERQLEKSPPQKPLPDYTHGHGWNLLPEPTYPYRDLADPQKLYAARNFGRFWDKTAEYNNRVDHDRTPIEGECPGSGVRMTWIDPRSRNFPSCVECGASGIETDYALRAESHPPGGHK